MNEIDRCPNQSSQTPPVRSTKEHECIDRLRTRVQGVSANHATETTILLCVLNSTTTYLLYIESCLSCTLTYVHPYIVHCSMVGKTLMAPNDKEPSEFDRHLCGARCRQIARVVATSQSCFYVGTFVRACVRAYSCVLFLVYARKCTDLIYSGMYVLVQKRQTFTHTHTHTQTRLDYK